MRFSNGFALVCLIGLIVASCGVPVLFIGPTSPTALRDVLGSAQPVAAAAPALASRVVRVAVYNEPNTTLPDYATVGVLRADISAVVNVLTGAGCQVTALTTTDILDHALLTARYDVLVLVDNLPRESIVNAVKEFWLGGGGILSLDSAISFVCYAGMIPPESEGDENYGVYWEYSTAFADNDVTARHSATKAFHSGDTVTTSNASWAVFLWNAIGGTSVGADLVRLGRRSGVPNAASMVALDPTEAGGRVVQLPTSGSPLTADIQAILPDAVNWLCPRPKARIVFDLSHRPGLGIDPWDTLTQYPDYYWQMRDSLVSHGYTVDKLYPSASGNFTAARLAVYDLLIVVAPATNFTVADRAAVTSWVQAGHGLLVFGENPGTGSFMAADQRINFLLESLDLRISLTSGSGLTRTISGYTAHPTGEACSDLRFATFGYLNVTGSAYPIWNYTTAVRTVVAGQTYGQGRVILTGDVHFADRNRIGEQDNAQYLVNLANWLTAASADVLLYVDEPSSPNDYRTPLCQALNDLSVSYALTFTGSYFNLSLNLYSWALVIVDNCGAGITSYFDDIGQYVDAGGRLIFSGRHVDNVENSTLWPKLGFAYAADMPDTAPVYIWSAGHAIFTQPNAYHVSNFTPTLDFGADEGDLLTVYANATALAGGNTTATAGQAIVVLRNDQHTLYNGYLIDQFAGDLDDSTYEDRFELWENEIAFMLASLVTLPPLPWWVLPVVMVIIVLVVVVVIVVVAVRQRKASAK